MTKILLAGPQIEPITIGELKDYLQISRNDENLLLSAIITSARIHIENVTRRMLITQRWRLVIDSWPQANELSVNIAPLQSLDGFWVRDRDGQWQEEQSDSYWLDTSADPGKVVLKRGSSLIQPLVYPSGIAFDFTAGYGNDPDDLPFPLREAVRQTAAYWFNNRNETRNDRKGLSNTITTGLKPYIRYQLA